MGPTGSMTLGFASTITLPRNKPRLGYSGHPGRPSYFFSSLVSFHSLFYFHSWIAGRVMYSCFPRTRCKADSGKLEHQATWIAFGIAGSCVPAPAFRQAAVHMSVDGPAASLCPSGLGWNGINPDEASGFARWATSFSLCVLTPRLPEGATAIDCSRISLEKEGLI